MRRLTINGKEIHVSEFSSIERAQSYAVRLSSPAWVVLGDHDGESGVVWVCRPVDAERLIAAGYEYA